MAIYTQPTKPFKSSNYLQKPSTNFFNDIYRAVSFAPVSISGGNVYDLRFIACTTVQPNSINDISNIGSVDGTQYKNYVNFVDGLRTNAPDFRSIILHFKEPTEYFYLQNGYWGEFSGFGESIESSKEYLQPKLNLIPSEKPYTYPTSNPVCWYRSSSGSVPSLLPSGWNQFRNNIDSYRNPENTTYSTESPRTINTTNYLLKPFISGKLREQDWDPLSEGNTTVEFIDIGYEYLNANDPVSVNNRVYVFKKYGFECRVFAHASTVANLQLGNVDRALILLKTSDINTKLFNIYKATPYYITKDETEAKTYNIPLWNVPEIEGEGVWSDGVNIPNPDEPDRGQPENEYEDAPSEWDPDNPNIDNTNESDTIEEGNPTIVPVGQTHRFYAMTTNQVDNLITFIWSPDVESGLRKVYNTPSDTIFSCRMYPLPIDEIATLGEPVNVKLGNLEATTAAGYLLNDVECRYDMGSYHLKEYFGNFLDYGGHTKVEIYLPYIGFRNLDTDDVMGKVVSVSYIIDIVNGNCTAEVSADGNVVSVFDGNICVSLSIKSTNEDIIAAQNRAVAVNTAVSGVSNIISDFSRSIGKGIGSVVKAGASAYDSAIAIKNSRSNISRMGSASPFSNLYLPQEVFLVISRPRQSLPSNYGETYGYPCNITSQLNGVTGFTICDRVRLEGCPATREEKEAIINALSNGVIL